ncbi:MAG: pseudouridine-5'-phosphate glycosidase, partial [Anaerolineae bacterium]|nr:pseudouridine-5'-phosphate glycosidase [Anaerolineae bacterium]
TPEQAAAIAAARDKLGLQHATLITVPVPEADQLPLDEAERAISEATKLADSLGIHGKAVTPFVLGKVLEFTAGRSQQANIAALVNNAHIAAQIAVALAG